jgi:type IV secretory pathway VirB2 component (pilin)
MGSGSEISLRMASATLLAPLHLLMIYFRAKKQLSSGAVESMTNKIRSTLKNPAAFEPIASPPPKSLAITHLKIRL